MKTSSRKEERKRNCSQGRKRVEKRKDSLREKQRDVDQNMYDLRETCGNPWKKHCGNRDITVFIEYKNEKKAKWVDGYLKLSAPILHF